MMQDSSDTVLRRAEELVDRRRLLIGLCVAVAVAVLAAIPGIFTSAGGGQKRVSTDAAPAVASPNTTIGLPAYGTVEPVAVAPATDAAAPPTTRPALVLGTSYTRSPVATVAPPANKKASPTTTKAGPPPTAGGTAPTTPTSQPCRNSYDAKCGPFRWEPDPGPNLGVSGQITFSPPMPKAGDKVSFTVSGSDPDAAPLQECNVDFSDGPIIHCDPRPAIDPSYCPKQYGPWAPPVKKQGDLNSVWEHTFPEARSYKVSFDVRSAMQECNNPYASGTVLTTTVQVL